MARLPDDGWLIQQIDGEVVLFHEGTGDEIVRFDPRNADATARAQATIHQSGLTDEGKSFAHFWSGYFYAHTNTIE